LLVAALRLRSFGLGEVELEALDQRSVKLFPPIGMIEPDGVGVGDDQVGVLGPEVDDHRRAVDRDVVVIAL
jgi:hypothetical protein